MPAQPLRDHGAELQRRNRCQAVGKLSQRSGYPADRSCSTDIPVTRPVGCFPQTRRDRMAVDTAGAYLIERTLRREASDVAAKHLSYRCGFIGGSRRGSSLAPGTIDFQEVMDFAR